MERPRPAPLPVASPFSPSARARALCAWHGWRCDDRVDYGQQGRRHAHVLEELPPGQSLERCRFHQAALQQVSAKLQPAAAAATPEVLQRSAVENLLSHTLTLSPPLPL